MLMKDPLNCNSKMAMLMQ